VFDNPSEFQVGNIADPSREKTKFNQWSVGDFVKWSGGPSKLSAADARKIFGLRFSPVIEVKWSHHAAEEVRPNGWAAPGTGFTLGVLISGAFLERFRLPGSDEIRDFRLEKRGDYIAWRSAQFYHTWQALKESDFLTIRWWDADNPKV
jgi:hypothetical protein